MSINGFRLAGRYVKAACLKHKIKPISRLQYNEIFNACNLLLKNKNQLITLKDKINQLELFLPKSLYYALELAVLRNQTNLIGDIFKYWCLYYQQTCQQLVDIHSAQKLRKNQQDICVKFLQKYNDLEVDSQFFLNQELIAGIKIETPYLLFDNTLKNKINNITRFLKNYAGNI